MFHETVTKSYYALADRYGTVVDERDEAVKRLKHEREKTQKTIEDAPAAATRKADRMQAKIRELESEIELSDQKLASALGSGPEHKYERIEATHSEHQSDVEEPSEPSPLPGQPWIALSMDPLTIQEGTDASVQANPNKITRSLGERPLSSIWSTQRRREELGDLPASGKQPKRPKTSIPPRVPLEPASGVKSTGPESERQALKKGEALPLTIIESETADPASGASKDKMDSHPPGPPASEASTPKTTAAVQKGPYLAEPRIPPPECCFADQPETWGPIPRQWMTLEEQVEFAEELAKLEAPISIPK
ncbi:MAG: hypothetical protein Q9215_006737 [Flavoplaca cf. flavocitrina]